MFAIDEAGDGGLGIGPLLMAAALLVGMAVMFVMLRLETRRRRQKDTQP
jgi:hypothetical protein